MNKFNERAEKNLNARKQFTRNQELENPCWKEHNISLKCLDKNNYDYEKCTLQFENYKTCKSFWKHVVTDRTIRNIQPALPLPEDREKVKAQYFS
ncbi:coiled-coil-helix-coiled-coil-helix domain-containing protein 7 [Osmia lignaria lignaria]|uniref:coiled-coil-helix-coiled-coil-helix domain-containing protein 7 n=1 Tax=Osmia lignaria lignaria TaxID=1437193 RepID=UPI0014790A88|nr:coiled-coil-helix-coiled-coil-helix domain-containing protein 7 [Osmia lignaria]